MAISFRRVTRRFRSSNRFNACAMARATRRGASPRPSTVRQLLPHVSFHAGERGAFDHQNSMPYVSAAGRAHRRGTKRPIFPDIPEFIRRYYDLNHPVELTCVESIIPAFVPRQAGNLLEGVSRTPRWSGGTAQSECRFSQRTPGNHTSDSDFSTGLTMTLIARG
jgi:hypothetical protein